MSMSLGGKWQRSCIARSAVKTLAGTLVFLLTACSSGVEVLVSTTTSSHHQPSTGGEAVGSGAAAFDRVLSGEETFPDGFTVPAGSTWSFDPDVDTTVVVSGNVLVLGRLEMHPGNSDVDHVLRFEGIDESNFVGGGMDPVDSDVGLWVMDSGTLDLEGTEKTAWSYEYDPAWAGDEVVAAPNGPGDTEGFVEVTSTPPPNDLGYPTELLDLTRNVRIEGTPEGRTHVFIRSTEPQTIRYTAIRYVGPDPANFFENDSTGRYGLHFHHNGEGSVGSIVEGVVVRDTAAHAFVPHASHGITFRDTIAYHVAGEAYWWDEPTAPDDFSNDSNDIIWDRAVAADVIGANGGSNHRLAAFSLGRGENPSVTDSVAVGVQAQTGADRSGYFWPEKAEATWVFRGNTAHNNGTHGIFVWQNNELPHVIEDFTAYYNDRAGIDHGAYKNSYVYQGLTLLENGVDIVSHALGKPEEGASTDTQVWSDIRTDGGGLWIERHNLGSDRPVRFVRCDFSGVYVTDAEGEPGLYDFIDCGLEPADFDLAESNPDSIYRVQRSDGSAYALHGDGSVVDIPGFLRD